MGFTGVYNFLIFVMKYRSWVLISEAVLTCTHNLCFEQKIRKHQTFSLKIIIFTAVKNRHILYRNVLGFWETRSLV